MGRIFSHVRAAAEQLGYALLAADVNPRGVVVSLPTDDFVRLRAALFSDPEIRLLSVKSTSSYPMGSDFDFYGLKFVARQDDGYGNRR